MCVHFTLIGVYVYCGTLEVSGHYVLLFICHFNTSPANLYFSGVSVLANLLRMSGSKSLQIILLVPIVKLFTT